MRPATVILSGLLLCGGAAFAADPPASCSGSTQLRCNSKKVCNYNIDSTSPKADIVMDSTKGQSIHFYRSNKKHKNFRIKIKPYDCDQPDACKVPPFAHDYDGNDPDTPTVDTGPANAHKTSLTCQYKLSIKPEEKSDWPDPIIIVR